MDKKLTVIYDTNVLDIPGMLRKLADSIEANHDRFEVPEGMVLVLERPWSIDIYSAGMKSGGPEAHLLLCVAAQKMVAGVLEGKN